MNTGTEILRVYGLFIETDATELGESANVLNSMFVLSLKNDKTPVESYKTRLVSKGHRNIEKPFLFYDSAALKHSSHKIILSFASISGYKLRTQDVNGPIYKEINCFFGQYF